jgi:hypothetical protein
VTDPMKSPEIRAALAQLEAAEVGLDQAIMSAKQVAQQVPKTKLSEEDIRMIEEHARSSGAPRQLRELQERIDAGEMSWEDISSGRHFDDPKVMAALSTGVDGMRQAYTLIEEGQHIDDVIAAGAQAPIEPDRPSSDDDDDGDDDEDGEVFRGVY